MKSQRKIHTNRKPISDAEINSTKQDFNNMIEKLNNMTNNFGISNIAGWSMGIVTAVAISVGGWFLLNDKNQNPPEENIEIVSNKINNDTIVEKKGINPPIPEKLVYEEFTVNNKKDITIKTENGNTIFIPAKSFVDIEGNPVYKDVKIKFKDYHNPLEIYLSGIPMDYDSSGTNYTFESAGMFEISATKDGEDIYMKDGKYIDISLVSKTEEPYNFYEYDTINNSWEYQRKESKEDISELNEEYKLINEQLIGMENQYEEYASLPAPVEVSDNLNEVIDYSTNLKTRNPDRYAISVKGDNDKNQMFEISPGQRFKEEYYKVRWDNIRVSKNDDNENYTISLEKGRTKYNFDAYPVMDKAEAERLNSEIAEMEQKRNDKIASRRKIGKEIKKKRLDLAQTEELLNNGFASRRSIRVINFGLYNCDRPLPKPIMAKKGNGKFLDPLGNEIKTFNLNIAQPSINVLWKYNRDEWYYSGNTDNLIWFLTDKEQIAILTPENFNAASSEKYFNLYSVDQGLMILGQYFPN